MGAKLISKFDFTVKADDFISDEISFDVTIPNLDDCEKLRVLLVEKADIENRKNLIKLMSDEQFTTELAMTDESLQDAIVNNESLQKHAARILTDESTVSISASDKKEAAKIMIKYVDEIKGFDDETTWETLKTVNEIYYIKLLCAVAVDVIRRTSGAVMVEQLKN